MALSIFLNLFPASVILFEVEHIAALTDPYGLYGYEDSNGIPPFATTCIASCGYPPLQEELDVHETKYCSERSTVWLYPL